MQTPGQSRFQSIEWMCGQDFDEPGEAAASLPVEYWYYCLISDHYFSPKKNGETFVLMTHRPDCNLHSKIVHFARLS
jgi:hypothetical protein